MPEVESHECGVTSGVEQAWTVEAFRARAAQERLLELKAQAADEMAKWDRAIRDAADGGAPTRQLARVVGVSRQLVYAVLGTEPETQ
jgi:transposase-like protein